MSMRSKMYIYDRYFAVCADPHGRSVVSDTGCNNGIHSGYILKPIGIFIEKRNDQVSRKHLPGMGMAAQRKVRSALLKRSKFNRLVLQNDHRFLRIHPGKQIRRDDKPYGRISSHIGLLPVVMVSPADVAALMVWLEKEGK